jgi:tetratricopeptide (TPR) repeat protein
MLGLAEQLLRRGQTREAEAILDLLTSDPDPGIRNEARFRRALLLKSQGRNREAAILLRRILDENPRAVVARLQLAEALQAIGDTNGALRELRAAQSSGLPPDVARVVDRYSLALRARRPQGASLKIAIAPDSNINRATRSDTLGTVFGDFEIADKGKAKSGIGLSLDALVFRRFAIARDTNLLVRASGFANLYRHGRFNDLAADLAAGPEFSFGRDQLQLELGATQRWFGQKPYLRSARLAGTFSHPVGRSTLLRVSGSAALIDNHLNDLQDGKGYSGQFQIERALTPTTGIAASLALDRQALKDPGYATTSWRTGLTVWHELGRMTVTATAEWGRLHADDRLWLFPERREDRYARYSLGVAFRQLQVAGFAPLLRFSVERNRSTIAFYDYRRSRAEIGIDRAF